MNNINPNLNTNLFKKIKNSLLAKSKYNFCNFIFFLISISLIAKILTSIFINSNWEVVTSNLNLYAFGSFPIDQQWRPTLWFLSILSITFVILFIISLFLGSLSNIYVILSGDISNVKSAPAAAKQFFIKKLSIGPSTMCICC